MSASRATVFEVTVKEKHNKFKDLHFEKRFPYQAIQAAQKYGKVMGIRKVDYTEIFGNIENLQLNQAPLIQNPYESALHMDEFIWKKRYNRRKNLEKDKKPID